MCHEWWMRHMQEEREAGRRLWDEFERTEPLSQPESAEEEAEFTLERRETKPLAASAD